MTTTKARIGDVLELERIPVNVDPSQMYRHIGIRSYGNGIFHRGPDQGDELSRLNYYALNPDRIVVSNIMAWEGAIALSSDLEDGFIASSRFLSYRKIGTVDLAYLNYFFQSSHGISLIRGASTGTVTRNQTLTPKNFENIEVSLPDLDEQRRIAAKLDSNIEIVSTFYGALSERTKLRQATFDAAIDDTLGITQVDKRKFARVGDVATINPRPSYLAADEIVVFVPMAKVDDRSGVVAGAEYKTVGESGKGYRQFLAGDVLFARITPCMQNGKSAIFQDSFASAGLGSTEFHVVRPEGSVSPEWIHAVLRSRKFREEASKNMSGTAGQQRVSAQFLKDAWVPVPVDGADEAETLQKISTINQKRLRVESLHREQEQHLKALRSSLLNAAFSGRL